MPGLISDFAESPFSEELSVVLGSVRKLSSVDI